MKKLITILILFLCTGGAWGDEIGIIGDSAVAEISGYGGAWATTERVRSNNYTASGFTAWYTAGSGQAATKIFVTNSASAGATMEVAIYVAYPSDDSLGARVYMDTVTFTTGNTVDSTGPFEYALTNGVTYAIAWAALSTTINTGRVDVGTTRAYYNTGELTDPWAMGSQTASVYRNMIWGRVSTATASATPLSVGPATLGAVQLAHPQ